MNRDHHAIGARARSRGGSFEAEIEAANDAAVARHLVARLTHVGPPHERTGPGGARVVITGPGGADYQGQTVDGRAIAMEAKCRAGRLRWVEVEEHQRQDLDACHRSGGVDACHRSGGVAVLLYRWTTPDRRTARTFAVPWGEVPWRQLDGRPTSVGPEELAPWEVPPRALLDPRDAGWAFYLAPLLAPRPLVLRLPEPALRAWAASLVAMADGRRADSRLAVGDVEMVVRAQGGGR